MENTYQTTAFVKQDPELALTTNCPFLAPERSDCNKETFVSMDLAGFLGEKVVPDQGDRGNADWNSLFSGELDGLDFLDPSTGMPTSVMAELPNANVGAGDSVGPRGSQMLSLDSSSSAWLFEQTQKLEKQQQLQQQRLFELQQTLLQTEILKNQLQIANNLKSTVATSSPGSHHSQLLSSINNSPATSTSPSTASNLGTSSSHQFSFDGMCGVSSSPQLSPTPTLNSGELTTLSQEKESHECFEEPETKKKSHNLIEKKYRTSINDRIGLLRDIVSKHFKDDRKAQKSAVLQKTIDYIRFLENANRRLLEENKRLRFLLKGAAQPTAPDSRLPPRHQPLLKTVECTSVSNCASSSSQGPSPLSLTESSDEGHPPSPDVFLSDQSAQSSPKLQCQVSTPSSSFFLSQFASSPLSGDQLSRATNRFLLCFMLVAIFLVDPLTLIGQSAQPPAVHGPQRTLNWFGLSGVASPEEFTLGVALVWTVRLVVALCCFGLAWLYALPKIHDGRGVKFWRYRKQAELDVKKGEFSSARRNAALALAEVGMSIPVSYSSLTLCLIWQTMCHVMFQLYVGRVAVWFVQVFKWGRNKPNQVGSKTAQSVCHSDVAQCLHLLHQLSLSSYEGIKIHGIGFYLGLSALNFAEVLPDQFSKEKWAEMMFAMAVQCQFSCACVASLFARYYFLCAGDLGGLLSFATSESGWEYLLSKHWVRDVQIASKLYPSVAAFPKYSVARSYCKALLTDSLRDLLLPNQQDSSSVEECLENFKSVLDASRNSSTYVISDIKLLNGGALNLSDVLATQESGFVELMWWASVGIVATHWQNGDIKKAEEHYVVIEEICEQSAPVAALHLAFKAQQMHHSAVQPPLSVVMQLCSLASDSLKTCEQTMSSEDNLHQLGLLLACDWLLCLRYSLWQSYSGSALGSSMSEEYASRQLCSGYAQDVDMLAHLVMFLPAAFPRLNMYKGYQHAMSGGNPVHTDKLLQGTAPSSFRQRTVVPSPDS